MSDAEAKPDPTAALIAELSSNYDKPADIAKVRALIAAGIRLDATDANGDTLLTQCVKMKKGGAAAKLLIDAGVPLEKKNREGMTPLVYAAWFGVTDIALELIKAGAQVNECDLKGNSALLLTMNCGHLEIAKSLLDKNADIDAEGFGEKMTPLMIAVIKHQPEMAKILLKKGCNIDAVRDNQFKDTALSMAQEMGSPSAKLIQKEINARAERARRDEFRRVARKREMLDNIGKELHTGTRKVISVMSLRLKIDRSFLWA